MATQARHVDPRSEPRYQGLFESAILTFRGVEHSVPVVDISTRGTQIECDLLPRLGESVLIRFDGCSPIYAFVRWNRDGRLGLNFGCELVLGLTQ
jgi:PilZ domain-containing protein